MQHTKTIDSSDVNTLETIAEMLESGIHSASDQLNLARKLRLVIEHIEEDSEKLDEIIKKAGDERQKVITDYLDDVAVYSARSSTERIAVSEMSERIKTGLKRV